MIATRDGELPLFPLHTVLFPGGRLPLQIFEARYVDLVSHCLREDSPFVVVLIRDGQEVVRERNAEPPSLCEVGTLARIADFDTNAEGTLRVVADGVRRVRLSAARQVDNHLLVGTASELDDAADELGPEHKELADILGTLSMHPLIQRLGVDCQAQDTHRLSCLLGQYLPLEETLKQSLLVLDDSRERLDAVARLVRQIQEQEDAAAAAASKDKD